jgi:hypothetical protein
MWQNGDSILRKIRLLCCHIRIYLREGMKSMAIMFGGEKTCRKTSREASR